MVARTRFELVISALRGRRPEPLDERAIWCNAGDGWDGGSRTPIDGTRIRCPAIRRHPNECLQRLRARKNYTGAKTYAQELISNLSRERAFIHKLCITAGERHVSCYALHTPGSPAATRYAARLGTAARTALARPTPTQAFIASSAMNGAEPAAKAATRL